MEKRGRERGRKGDGEGEKGEKEGKREKGEGEERKTPPHPLYPLSRCDGVHRTFTLFRMECERRGNGMLV